MSANAIATTMPTAHANPRARLPASSPSSSDASASATIVPLAMIAGPPRAEPGSWTRGGPHETLSLADLDVDAEDAVTSRSIMIALSEKPPRAAGVKIVDDGDAGEKLAEFLIQNRLA